MTEQPTIDLPSRRVKTLKTYIELASNSFNFGKKQPTYHELVMKAFYDAQCDTLTCDEIIQSILKIRDNRDFIFGVISEACNKNLLVKLPTPGEKRVIAGHRFKLVQ